MVMGWVGWQGVDQELKGRNPTTMKLNLCKPMTKYFSFLFSLFPYSSFASPQFRIRWNSDEEENRKKKKRKKKGERKKKKKGNEIVEKK